MGKNGFWGENGGKRIKKGLTRVVEGGILILRKEDTMRSMKISDMAYGFIKEKARIDERSITKTLDRFVAIFMEVADDVGKVKKKG